MENKLVLAGIISVVFFIIKFIDIKFIKKEDEPLKPITIDALIVFLSVFVGLLISEQFGMVKNLVGGATESTKAFVSNPEF